MTGTNPPSRGLRQRIRATFHSADARYLYVEADGERLRVRHDLPPFSEEFAHTLQALWPGAQVNLLDVARDQEGCLLPTALILEPDYLMDISALAECFRDYGSHPLNYLLARLRPSECTAPLLLGNIANLFLDEWIHSDEAHRPDYPACMRKAFHTFPIELAACPDLRDPQKERDFFANTRLHFDHLRHTVCEAFPRANPPLDKEDAVVEPSYLCEALGLQGRLDYMQRDCSSFIEMKSGKADQFSTPDRVKPKENNWVQMLLYEAVLHYALGVPRSHIHAYLLYTRYPLLYPLHTSGGMLRRVLDVRNRIVALEHELGAAATPDATDLRLRQINPQTLNERNRHDLLWERYQKPQIEEWAALYQGLQPVERAYFCSLYAFITRELCLSKCSALDAEGSRMGAATLWLASLQEKVDAGEILHDLTLLEVQAASATKPYILLARPAMQNEADILPNFRPGDAVVLYERNDETDNVTNRLIFKGTVETLDERSVRIRLRQPQRNPAVLPTGSRYAVEHDTMDTTFRSMYQGLSLFLRTNPQRRALLLGQRPPAFDTVLDEAVAHATDDFGRVILKARAARDYFLLIGPPGTGKTSHALRGMVERFHRDGEQVLLLAYTNRAVDEVCKALAAIRPEVDFIRLGSELSCEEAYRPHLAENALASCANRSQVVRRLEQCRLFVGTVATLSIHTELFRLKRFDVAIVDEATQILEPQLLGLLCARDKSGRDAIGRFILIGDHKQLPAVVLQDADRSAVADPLLQGLGFLNLRDSLFERLYRHLRGDNSSQTCRAYDMLCRQGRMNVEVARFPSQAFYGGRLTPVGLPHQEGSLTLSPALQDHPLAPLLLRRVGFLPSVPEPSGHSVKVNHSEARQATLLATALYRQYASTPGGFTPQTLGIITPYRSQIALLRRALEETGIEALRHVTIDTVERFQGSERDVIIYSCCLNRTEQLAVLANLTDDEGITIDRKLNVALTRARLQFFLIGAPALLRQSPIYRSLLESILSGQETSSAGGDSVKIG